MEREREMLASTRRSTSRGPAATSTPPARTLVELQRTAGNRAVARLLQRTVIVGQPGANNVRTTYDAAHAGSLVAALNVPIANMPGWMNVWLQPHLTAIEAAAAPYEFDNATDVAWWIVIRELARDLLAYVQQARVPANRDVGDKARVAYAAIEAQRQLFAAQGAINGQYQLFGLTYQLTSQGANHFYASRPAGRNIEYHGLRRGRAKAIVNQLIRNGPAARNPVDAAEVDDFVCAFLAEPTRWPEEQLLNILTLTRGGEDVLTGAQSEHALPMAGGTTWNVALGQLGRQLPKRAIQHATSEGLMAVIQQELPAAANWGAFLTAMRGQLEFN